MSHEQENDFPSIWMVYLKIFWFVYTSLCYHMYIRKTHKIFLNVCCAMVFYVFCVALCVGFCTGQFVMVPLNFEHLFNLYWHIYIVYNILFCASLQFILSCRFFRVLPLPELSSGGFNAILTLIRSYHGGKSKVTKLWQIDRIYFKPQLLRSIYNVVTNTYYIVTDTMTLCEYIIINRNYCFLYSHKHVLYSHRHYDFM